MRVSPPHTAHVHMPINSNALDQVQKQPNAHDLNGNRKRLVVNIFGEEMNGFWENFKVQIHPNVMNEIAQSWVSERTKGFEGSVAASEEQIFVEKKLDWGNEMSSKIGRQNVADGDEKFLAEVRDFLELEKNCFNELLGFEF